MAKILYRKLLDLDLWHDYFLGQGNISSLSFDRYTISSTLTLFPTAACAQELKRLRWLFRPSDRGASIFALVDEIEAGVFATAITVDSVRRLTFGLASLDPNFANFSNLPLERNGRQLYYLSNLSGNGIGSELFLSQSLPPYDPASTYDYGALVVNGGETLEAIARTAPAATPQADEWETFADGGQYVTSADRHPQQGTHYTHTIASANPGDRFSFSLTDASGRQTFTSTAIVPDEHPAASEMTVHLNFSGVEPGRYQLLLNGVAVQEANFVLFDPLAARASSSTRTGRRAPLPTPFALVEVFVNEASIAPQYQLLQASSDRTVIQPQTYVTRFKNRSTHWRYTLERPHGLAEPPPTGWAVVSPLAYATDRPIGLRERPDSLPLLNSVPQPAPSVRAIVPELDDSRNLTAIYSDTFL